MSSDSVNRNDVSAPEDDDKKAVTGYPAHQVPSVADGEVDVGAQILADAGEHGPISQEEMDAVLRKIDWHMVPMLLVCMQLSGWDKVM